MVRMGTKLEVKCFPAGLKPLFLKKKTKWFHLFNYIVHKHEQFFPEGESCIMHCFREFLKSILCSWIWSWNSKSRTTALLLIMATPRKILIGSAKLDINLKLGFLLLVLKVKRDKNSKAFVFSGEKITAAEKCCHKVVPMLYITRTLF